MSGLTDTGTDQGSALDAFLIGVESLPAPPALLFEILDYTTSEDLSIRSLAEMVGRDASLAAKLLQIANSSIYSFPGEIASLERAVMVLGIKSVRLLTLSLTLTGLFPVSVNHAAAVTEVRRRSLVNALANRAFMGEIDGALTDEGFLTGLLSNIGALAIEKCAPILFAQLFGEAATAGPAECRLDWPSKDRQIEVLGFAIDDLTATLFSRWGLPDVLADAVRHRHVESAGGAEPEELQRSLRLGSMTEEVLCGTPSGNALTKLTEIASDELHVSRERIEELLIELGPLIAETAQLFGLELNREIDLSEIVARSTEAVHQLSVEALTMLAHQSQHLADLERENEALSRDSRVDSLTGLSNLRAFHEGIEVLVAIRRRRPMDDALGLMMFAIDHLAEIVEVHGNQIAEEVVRHVGLLMAAHCRVGEDFYRVGVDEFALVMPHSSLDDLGGAAERFRSLIEQSPLFVERTGEDIPLTITVGAAVAEAFDDADASDSLTRAAAHQLLTARAAGRNSVSVQLRPST